MAKGKVGGVNMPQFVKFDLASFLKGGGLKKISEYAVNTAKIPVRGRLSNGSFEATEKGHVTLATLSKEFKRSVSAPIAYILANAESVLAWVRPEVSAAPVGVQVKRLDEKTVMADLLSSFGLEDESSPDTDEDEDMPPDHDEDDANA